jgi:hypothetical protein
LFLVVFGSIPAPKRLEIYGGFLHHLKVWQARYMREALGRFGFMWDWEGRLKEIVQAFRGDQKPKNTTS